MNRITLGGVSIIVGYLILVFYDKIIQRDKEYLFAFKIKNGGFLLIILGICMIINEFL
jgi:hypothetical protein